MKRGTFALLVAPAVVLLALFFGLPVAGVVVDAFRDGLGAFGRVVAMSTFWPLLLGSSVLTAAASTLTVCRAPARSWRCPPSPTSP